MSGVPAPGATGPAAAARAGAGELAMEAVSVSKDFKIGHGQVLHAVRDVSLSLYQSWVVALVGESGSGKSTVARLLAGQEQLTSGTIALHGKPVHLSSRRAFRRHKSEVQLVFQDPFASLNPVHTVRYHLQRPVALHQGGLSRDQANQEITALMEQVRLLPARQFLAKYPHELSGGQRQRVSFARALAAKPSVLLADEPVSMLDVSIRLEMLSLLDELRRSFQLALLYITHDIASARYFADEVQVMYAGQIVERGPAEELTQRPAHPYTQLLIASAPDPDNLGSALRGTSQRAAAQTANGSPANGSPASGGPASGRPAHGPAAQAATARALTGGPATTGCPFTPRCPFADDKCRAQNPALLPISASRAAACWHLDAAAPGLLAGTPGPQGGGE
jgi:peptide/nickel transport system ATP-binding protein